MYPFGAEHSVSLRVPQITETLEGAHRPGHFDGVATVVCKLFNLVQPDLAVFGQKDFQQLKVIERMVRDLSLPVKVMAAPTLRADDGLALSSRNQYLSADERARAPLIHDTLLQDARAARQGPRVAGARAGGRGAAGAGRVSCPTTWRFVAPRTWPNRPTARRDGLVALIAARLGNTRLIDNLLFD